MSLSSEECAALDRHHYVQGYSANDIHDMPLDDWTVLDKLHERGLLTIDSTFVASSGNTYISTSPKGAERLRWHRFDVLRRRQEYRDQAEF